MTVLRSATVEHGSIRRSAATTTGAVAEATALDVLVLGTSTQLGGAERALLDMVTALRTRNPLVRIAVLVTGDGPLADALVREGTRVIRLPLPEILARVGDSALRDRGPWARLRAIGRLMLAVPPAFAYVMRLSTTMRALRPSVVHSNGFKMHVLGALARPSGAVLVWHLHDFTSNRPLMSRALRVLARRAAGAIANSRSVASDAVRVWGATPAVSTVYNAIDLERFSPDGERADLDALAGMPAAPPGTVRVGLVATLAAWKGHDVLLHAIARLPRDLPVRAYIVAGAIYQTAGSQSSLGELRVQAARLGIADRVGFTGFVPDAAPVMRALDVVVHASILPEPFGLVIAEGMASGRAVVVSAAGGAAELIDDGVDALAHPPGDSAALAECIERLARDAALRARLGSAARRAACLRFDRSRLGAEVAAAHASALAAR